MEAVLLPKRSPTFLRNSCERLSRCLSKAFQMLPFFKEPMPLPLYQVRKGPLALATNVANLVALEQESFQLYKDTCDLETNSRWIYGSFESRTRLALVISGGGLVLLQLQRTIPCASLPPLIIMLISLFSVGFAINFFVLKFRFDEFVGPFLGDFDLRKRTLATRALAIIDSENKDNDVAAALHHEITRGIVIERCGVLVQAARVTEHQTFCRLHYLSVGCVGASAVLLYFYGYITYSYAKSGCSGW